MKVPEGVNLGGDALEVTWNEGRRAAFPYRLLRLLCACARCEDEMTGERKLDAMSVPSDIMVVEWLRVGRYALQFLWSDGHDTGIFPYEMLERIANHHELWAAGVK